MWYLRGLCRSNGQKSEATPGLLTDYMYPLIALVSLFGKLLSFLTSDVPWATEVPTERRLGLMLELHSV